MPCTGLGWAATPRLRLRVACRDRRTSACTSGPDVSGSCRGPWTDAEPVAGTRGACAGSPTRARRDPHQLGAGSDRRGACDALRGGTEHLAGGRAVHAGAVGARHLWRFYRAAAVSRVRRTARRADARGVGDRRHGVAHRDDLELPHPVRPAGGVLPQGTDVHLFLHLHRTARAVVFARLCRARRRGRRGRLGDPARLRDVRAGRHGAAHPRLHHLHDRGQDPDRRRSRQDHLDPDGDRPARARRGARGSCSSAGWPSRRRRCNSRASSRPTWPRR